MNARKIKWDKLTRKQYNNISKTSALTSGCFQVSLIFNRFINKSVGCLNPKINWPSNTPLKKAYTHT